MKNNLQLNIKGLIKFLALVSNGISYLSCILCTNRYNKEEKKCHFEKCKMADYLPEI